METQEDAKGQQKVAEPLMNELDRHRSKDISHINLNANNAEVLTKFFDKFPK